MIPFALHRHIPLLRRPFYQRDQAIAERDEALAALRDAIDRPPPVTTSDPLVRFETRVPSAQSAIDIFRGRWACDLSPLIGVTGTGSALLFTEDKRPLQAAETLGRNGRFDGFDVLELGPLEAAHTYLLEGLGAASITAVETSVEAYLKCLIVKEVLGLKRSKFLLGDVVEYLASANRFDLIFCSGILYHMAEPLTLIQKVCSLTDRCFVWTHYYDAERHPVPFEATPKNLDGFTAAHWSHTYGDRSSQFWGGNKATASWLEKSALIDAFRYYGLSNVTVILDHNDHPNGPSVTFSAQR